MVYFDILVHILQKKHMVLREFVYLLTLVIYQTPLNPGTLFVKNEQRPKLSIFLNRNSIFDLPG